ncbi:hypothetical protein BH11BAC5_BH11BAC5_14180 [soil metagenome]
MYKFLNFKAQADEVFRVTPKGKKERMALC